jgi:hypothetical protein
MRTRRQVLGVMAAGATAGLLPGLARAEDRAPNTLSADEEKAGFKLLFDGKSTASFRSYKGRGLHPNWKAVDGALTLTKKGAGNIITKDQFEQFELILEYRIGKAGNSGLMFHVTEDEGQPWMTGPEVQIQDNKDGHDPQKSGWLYQLYPAETDATKPVGEWNELRLLVSKAEGRITMNGVKYCEFVKGSDDWNQKVAKSKFAKMAKFGKPTTGHIALQDHGDPVSFRNIRIRVIT